MSGAVVDAFILGATVTAYEVNAAGVVGACVPASPGPCATATSDSKGNYTVDLGSYAGATLLEAVGGSYTDTVTGQVVPVPNSVTLSSFLPPVPPGTPAPPVQITGLTTMAANLALGQMAPPLSLGAAAAADAGNTQVENLFGVVSVGQTTLLDLADPACAGPGVTQASFDASLLLAGIAQLAAQYGVTSIDLMNAIATDLSSNGGTLTGLFAGGGPIDVGGTTLPLSLVESTSLGQSIEGAIGTFVGTVRNACKAAQSPVQKAALQAPPPPKPACSDAGAAAFRYCYSVGVNYTGPAGIVVKLGLSLGCPDDRYGSTAAGFQGVLAMPAGSSPTAPASAVIVATAGAPGSYAGSPTYAYQDDCGTNTGTVELQKGFQPVNCTFSPSSVTFTSTDGGFHNTATAPVAVTCTPGTYTVGGVVADLPAGASITLKDALNGDSVVVGSSGLFTLPSLLGVGTPYQVVVAVQPAGLPTGQVCTVAGGDFGNGGGTVNGPVGTVVVSCPLPLPAATLSNPNGLAFGNGRLYVANAGGDQVLVYAESGTGLGVSLALVDVIPPTAGLVNPTRLAFDASGRYLFVAYGHQGSAGSIAIYDTKAANTQVGTVGDAHIVGPLGVAVDGYGDLIVAENSTSALTVFTPNSPGDPGAGYTFAFEITGDGAGNAFVNPGALTYYAERANGDYLLVGLSSGAVSVYAVPLSRAPSPLGMVTCAAGATGVVVAPGSSTVTSALYVTYFGGTASDYLFQHLFGPAACPTALGVASGLASPEGVAVDGFGNVFVSSAGANQIVAYGPALGIPLFTFGP